MKDMIAKYKKRTFFQGSMIVVTSLAIALGVNMYVLDGNIGNYLKASVLDINGVEQSADIYGRVSNDRQTIILGSQKQMNNVESISLSLVYDDTQTTIHDIKTISEGTEATSLSSESGVQTIIVTFDTPQTLTGESDFLEISVSKETQTTGYLNIINANFTDSEQNQYLLSTSGILF